MEQSKYQVVFLGSSNVGKTELFNRMTGKYIADVKPTINVNSRTISLNIKDKEIKIELWDTAGQEKYRSISSFYTKKADGIFLVFDLSDLNVQEDELKYIRQQIENAPENVSVLIIGNKVDLIDINNNQLTPQIEYIKNQIEHFDYIQTSALNGSNVSEALELMANKIEENQPTINEPNVLKNQSSLEKISSNCC